MLLYSLKLFIPTCILNLPLLIGFLLIFLNN